MKLKIIAGIIAIILFLNTSSIYGLQATRLKILEAPTEGVVGEEISIIVQLTDMKGNSLAGETISVLMGIKEKEYGASIMGINWTVLGDYTTADDGTIIVKIIPEETGKVSFKIIYEGSEEYIGMNTATVIQVEEKTGGGLGIGQSVIYLVIILIIIIGALYIYYRRKKS